MNKTTKQSMSPKEHGRFPHVQLAELTTATDTVDDNLQTNVSELKIKMNSLEEKMERIMHSLEALTRTRFQVGDVSEDAETPMARQASNQSNSLYGYQNAARRDSFYFHHISVGKSPSFNMHYQNINPENVPALARLQEPCRTPYHGTAIFSDGESVDNRSGSITGKDCQGTIRWYLVHGMGRLGKTIELFILSLILTSVILYILSTYDIEFKTAEYVITFVFTTEYITRVFVVKNQLKFIFSMFGMIDLISIVPTYLALFLDSSAQTFLYIRAIRSVRAFRFFKYIFKDSTFNSRPSDDIEQILETKFCCFTFSLLHIQMAKSTVTMFLLLFVLSGIFFSLEGPDSEFVDEPTTETFFETFYFMLVSVSTVGYGEIHPMSWAGQLLMIFAIPASLIMLPIQYKTIGESYEVIEKTRERQWREKRRSRKEKRYLSPSPNPKSLKASASPLFE